jgi:Tol biopolymer transport system component
MWMTGNQLYTLDTRSGAVKELQEHMRMDGTFQWHPTQSGLLVYSDSSSNGSRLATLDVLADKVTYLLSNDTGSTHPAWVRNGQAILYALRNPGAPFSLANISLIDWPSGTARAVTRPNMEAGEEDDWAQMLPDGKLFIYIRRGLFGGKELPVELRLGSLDGSLDARLATGLTQLQLAPIMRHWETLVVYTP